MTTPGNPVIIPADNQTWLGYVEMHAHGMLGTVLIAPVFGFKYEGTGLAPLLYEPQLGARVDDGIVTRADGVHNAAKYFLTEAGMADCHCSQSENPQVLSGETGSYYVPLAAHDEDCSFANEWRAERESAKRD
jgi:hypothetical protein